MFIHTNQPLITPFYIKEVPIFCRISDESALIRNFLRNGRVRVKPKELVMMTKNAYDDISHHLVAKMIFFKVSQ